MEKKDLLKFLETPKTVESIEKAFGKQKEIYKSLKELYESEKIRYVESSGVSYFEKTNHEFNLTTTRIIAQSAGYICSNPECRILTIAGSEVLKNKVIKIGEGAHIIGNKESSARYEEKPNVNKNSVENGIWLCRNCHKMVDSNKGKGYPFETLMQWKKEHISYLSKNLGKPVNLSTDNLKTAQSFKSWTENLVIKSPKIFIRDPDRDLIMQKIKETLSLSSQNNRIIRLSGLSGLGKTRIIYETLKSSNLKENTYYYDNSSSFLKSEIYLMLKNNIQVNLILVIDNCTINDYQKIKENFSLKTNKTVIVTIGFHNERHNYNEIYFQLDFMNPTSIEKILKINFGKIPKKRREEIINASHCFPKFALKFISDYYKGNANYIVSEYNINRLIFGEKTNSNEGTVKKILIHIALFSRLGYSGKIKDEYFKTSEWIGYPLGNLNSESYNELLKLESEWVCSLVELNWADYISVVDDLKKKGIIRGDLRIEISSIPLTIFLINEWWSQNSDAVKTITIIPKKLIFYLTYQFFFFMKLFCLLEESSESYKNIIKFMKNLEEKGLYLDKILDFVIYRYKDIKPFDREMLLKKIINREDYIIELLKSLLKEHVKSLKLRDKIKWIKIIIKKLSIEKISQILNEWPVYVSKSKGKIILIDEFLKLIKDINWNYSILQTLYTYYDYLSDQLKIQFMNQIEKNSEYISRLIAIIVNRPSEESLIIICKKLINSKNNTTIVLNTLAFIQNVPLIKLRKYLLIELSKNEGSVKFLLVFIFRNQDILDDKIVQELVRNTNKYTSIAGKAFQNYLFEFLNQKKFTKITPLIKTYEESKDIIQAKNSFYDFLKSITQMELLIYQTNLPNFKMLSENYKPLEIQYLIISLNVSERSDKKFYDFYNIFLKYDFFYYINSIIFPNANFYENSEGREIILKDFKNNGFYLVDFNPFLNMANLREEDMLFIYENSFKLKLEQLISKEIPVIIIDDELFQGLYENLKNDGFNIIHKQAIPKPNEKNYNRFKELFKDALTRAGYKLT